MVEDGDIEAGEQTVYACSGSTLVLQCGENNTSEEYKAVSYTHLPLPTKA